MKNKKRILFIFVIIVFISSFSFSQGKLKFTDTRFVAYMEHTGDYSLLSKKFDIIYNYLMDFGYKKNGYGESVFYSSTLTPKIFSKSEARIPVYFPGIYPPCSKDEVKFKRVRAELVAYVVYKGSYKHILKAYGILNDYIDKNNLKIVGNFSEVFYNTPYNTPEQELLTEVRVPVNRKGKVDIGIYIDPGAFYKNLQASQEFFEWAKISYKTVKAKDIIKGKIFNKIKVIYFPGGWAGFYSRDIGKKGGRNIVNFIKNGGKFLGICAGAYFGAKNIVWENIKYKGILKLYDSAIGPINEISPWPNIGLANIKFSDRTNKKMYYLGGPYLKIKKEYTPLAYYSNGKLAAAYFSFGKGSVYLIGFHPEMIAENRNGETIFPLRTGKGVEKSGWNFLKNLFELMLGRKL